MTPSEPFLSAIKKLTAQGFDLIATLAFKQLPEEAQQQLVEAGTGANVQSHFLLIGNGGPRFWDHIKPQLKLSPDPFDQYSADAARAFASTLFPQKNAKLLYPGQTIVPLQQLGRLAGWHHPSPFGVGINKRWGSWYAYRALLMIDAPLPSLSANYGDSPCDQCKTQECLGSCPASALSLNDSIDIERCATYRLEGQSSCQDRCLARMSCPISKNEQYPLEQIQYHYRLSLETLRHYYG